ncbi:MAG TPA: type II toxin-antitoxin system RelE/ParE family toxin [Sphingomonas sp.]
MRLEISRSAVSDLIAHRRWLHHEAGSDVAERMLAGADRAFAQLIVTPGLGSPVATRLADLRKWRVAGFPQLLVLYRVDPDVLTVIRVLHAAQDWLALLDSD